MKNFFICPILESFLPLFDYCSCFGVGVRLKNSFGLHSFIHISLILYRMLYLDFLILSREGELAGGGYVGVCLEKLKIEQSSDLAGLRLG